MAVVERDINSIIVFISFQSNQVYLVAHTYYEMEVDKSYLAYVCPLLTIDQ